MSRSQENLPPVLPVGTEVVTAAEVRASNGQMIAARGSVGVVVDAPAGADAAQRYRVRLPEGEVVTLDRAEIDVLKHMQTRGITAADAAVDLYRHVIYRVVIGSRAYGLDHDESDTDRRGVYLPPSALHWSLAGVPEQLEKEATQECYWELQKFVTLALKANPNVLEVLYSPLVEHVDPLAEPLVDQRDIFLSRLVYQTFNGYVLSQFKKLNRHHDKHGTVKWKHAMHLIRLLLAGIATLRGAHVPVRVAEPHRDALLEIRDGGMPFHRVDAWRVELHREFDAAYASTSLPERPDYAKANAILIDARRSMAELEHNH